MFIALNGRRCAPGRNGCILCGESSVVGARRERFHASNISEAGVKGAFCETLGDEEEALEVLADGRRDVFTAGCVPLSASDGGF